MTAIALTPGQIELKKTIENLLDYLIQWNNHSPQKIETWLDQLSETAQTLHAQLKAEGQEPKHKPHVIAKRGLKPDDKDFYRHMHAAESLLIFIEEGGLTVGQNTSFS